MKPKISKRTVIWVGVFAASLLIFWIMAVLINGNNLKIKGPTGDRLPPHIEQVSPSDGEDITEWEGYCVHFLFTVGNGMGKNPESKIAAYLDGDNITTSLTGVISLDSPPSYGNYCYNSNVKISPGWHTAKVIYSDIKNRKFSYTWRILVNSE